MKKRINMELKKMKSMKEFSEINSGVENLKSHYDSQFQSPETKQNWYVGVTGQEKDMEFCLDRIREHHNRDYPNLDIDSIGYLKVSSIDVSIEIEKDLEVLGFDTGKSHQPPKDDNDIYVYLFRKEK